MEVTSTINNISVPKTNLNNNIDSRTDILNTVMNGKNNNKFDYSEVMMDLEEVQDFLFMLIGEESPAKAAKTAKGTNVNLFA